MKARRDLLLAKDGELAAVENFRKALLPSWGYRYELESACASLADKHALALVDDFRYAHEHFVRLEAARLATTHEDLGSVLNLELRSSSVSDETKTETDK